jgi:hypothetical protein
MHVRNSCNLGIGARVSVEYGKFNGFVELWFMIFPALVINCLSMSDKFRRKITNGVAIGFMSWVWDPLDPRVLHTCPLGLQD